MSTVHNEPHPDAGKTFIVLSSNPAVHCKTVRIDDWWDRVLDPAMNPYGDSEVVYGWDADSNAIAVRVCELGPEIPAGDAA